MGRYFQCLNPYLTEEREVLLLLLRFSFSLDILDADLDRLLDFFDNERLLHFFEAERLLDFFDGERLLDFLQLIERLLDSFDIDLLLDFFDKEQLLDLFDNDKLLLLDLDFPPGDLDGDFLDLDADLDGDRLDLPPEEDLDLDILFEWAWREFGDFLDLELDLDGLLPCFGDDIDFLLRSRERDLFLDNDLERCLGDLEDLFSNDNDLV